ncbi:bifunctional 4-hydroxy-2-oxoglutarate aldolase/2-dehydro-3-deoxy-phosphogluconate aldolase [Treponema sp.]|uniref:bifunctional 4-hydroxy-2-oxoglutarate aldolase/2-dehydro-3-deoxy-phosphogluconate aldolase n=1 Tax=Treponema sp. TaxID=166 RepID=UPI00298DE453|nr:bifunctional 4-hydroxy-2-oxoglutarate aldolase/2-dehydro-3-deoxy-phosphogluconate aldolase [Treponema sp.]
MNKNYLKNAENIFSKIREYKIIPLVKIENENDAEKTAERLIKAGHKIAEIAYRTACAGDCIKYISQNYADLLVGAGTVTNVKTARDAISNGAKFIVMPGFDKKTVLYCIKKGIPVIPGVMTPTEIMNASSYGLKVLKLFPAEVSGGIALLNALKGPFNEIKFIPTGGITEKNSEEYLKLSNVIATGGSWK